MKEFLLSNLKNNFGRFTLSLLILFLPTQLGKHIWTDFSFVLGQRIDYLSPTLYLTDIFIAILFLFFIAKKPCLKPPIPFCFFCFFLVFTIGIFLSLSPLAGWYGLLKLCELVFLGIYIAFYFRTYTIDIVSLFAAGVLFESILAIAQFLHHASLNGIFYFFGERSFTAGTPGIANASINGELVLRPYGTFPHPNVLAGYLIVAMIFILERVKKRESRSMNIFFILALIVGTIGLFLTLSRVAIFLWFIITTYWVISKFRAKILTTKYLLPSTFLVAGIALILILRPFSYRFTQLLSTNESITQRQQLIAETIAMILDHPLLGVGWNNFLAALPHYAKTNTTIFLLQPVHNIFLLTAAQAGIVGLLMFIWFLYKTYQHVFLNYALSHGQEKRNSSFLLIILTVILILGMFDHYWLTIQQGQLLFALVLGLCWAV